MFCEHCDSPSVTEELLQTEEYIESDGERCYIDLIAFTCQNCGYYWEEEYGPYT